MSVEAIPVRVTEVAEVTPLVKRFRFARPDGAPLPRFSGGAHVVVEMRDGETVRRNPYSLMSSPLDTSSYAISVRREDAGRGGSRFLHAGVRVGTELRISAPVNLFALDLRARKHLMIAGGIGITPFLAQSAQLAALGAPFELHYAARSARHAAYLADLPFATFHDDEAGGRMDLGAILSGQPLGTHVYVCGPQGMIDGVLAVALELGWPPEQVHYEHFLAPPAGAPFRVRLAASGIEIEVGGTQSLLEAMEAAGVAAPCLCRGGACGECETRVLSCDGEIAHHDHWLDPDARAAGDRIMPCVSRFRGASLVIDR